MAVLYKTTQKICKAAPRLATGVYQPELLSNHCRPYVKKERHVVVYQSTVGGGETERPVNLEGFPERGHERPRRSASVVRFLMQPRPPASSIRQCRLSLLLCVVGLAIYLLRSFPRTKTAVLVVRRAKWVSGYCLAGDCRLGGVQAGCRLAHNDVRSHVST